MFKLKTCHVGPIAICLTLDTDEWCLGLGYESGMVWFSFLIATVHFSHRIRWEE